MFPNLEFIKTALNAITCRFRNIQANVDDITDDIAVLKSDVASTEETIKASTADWNQNDESAVDYIKNKPFHEEITEETILGEYTGELSGLKPSSDLVYGDKYVIYLDGVRYDTECTEDSDANSILYVNTEHGWINIRDFCWEIQTNITGVHTLKVVHNIIDLYKIDSKFIDFPVTSVNGKTGSVRITASDIGAATTSQIAGKMNTYNPVGTGSFSMGRRSGTTIGGYSHAEGKSTAASGTASHAEGQSTTASGTASHAEGYITIADRHYSHAEGENTAAYGTASHVEGYQTVASGTVQHVQGKFNIIDTSSKYAHIVGNGINGNSRSNAHTLDWDGNAWFAGEVKVGGTGQDDIAAKTLATTEDIPAVDSTLTQSGQAADAAVVGQKFSSLSEDIAEIPQADWNQNDSTAADYVKNRPFYVGGSVETELFDVCALADAANISWVQVSEGVYQCTSDFDNNNFIFIETPPEVGSDCVVKCNGLSNNFIVQDGTTLGDPNFVMVGDTNGLTSENFTQALIILYPYNLIDASDTSGKYVLWAALVPSDTVPTELKVISNVQEIKKIDPKFETDPTVPAWAKQKNKPTYTADEVGAMSKTDPVGTGTFSMGRKSGTTIGVMSHAEGYNATASGGYSHAEGYDTTASGTDAHAEGYKTIANGSNSHAEGEGTTTASGASATHAEGRDTTASGAYAHAEGHTTTASGTGSHAEGYKTIANGLYSHAEGFLTKATSSESQTSTTSSNNTGNYTHAEGYGTVSYGACSHAEGNGTSAYGFTSHSEGRGTTASGAYAHAEGIGTTAQSKSQHVQGEYNVLDTGGSTSNRGKYAHIVGNGTSESARSNAHTLDWGGNAWYAGTVEGTALIIKSSTEGSTKRFKITVDDSGTLTATEFT